MSEQKTKSHLVLRVRVKGDDGYARALHETAQVLTCERCKNAIVIGEQFTKHEATAPILIVHTPRTRGSYAAYNNNRYPVCKTCFPFEVIE